MDYDTIKKMLITKPTELCLFEITCILINNAMKDYYKINKTLSNFILRYLLNNSDVILHLFLNLILVLQEPLFDLKYNTDNL